MNANESIATDDDESGADVEGFGLSRSPIDPPTDDGDDEVEGFAFGAIPPGPPVRPVLDGIAVPSLSSALHPPSRRDGQDTGFMNANEPFAADDDETGDDVEGFGLSLSPEAHPTSPILHGVTPPPPGVRSGQIRGTDLVSGLGGLYNANEPVLSDHDVDDDD